MPKSLVGQSQGNTYRQFLHVDGGVPDSTESFIYDGDGTETSVKIGEDSLDISTHNGSNKGLKLNATLLTADATDLNQLDERQIGQTGDNNVPTNSMLETITIDGGSF